MTTGFETCHNGSLSADKDAVKPGDFKGISKEIQIGPSDRPIIAFFVLRKLVLCSIFLNMDSTEIETCKRKLETLRLEHRDLDDVIARLSEDLDIDEFRIKRLKKRKLQLKDLIARLESELIPDLKA